MSCIKGQINFATDFPVINILNEICSGFDVKDFESKIGGSKSQVESLLTRLLKDEKNGVVTSYVNDAEIEILKRALHEVEKEIEEWEFSLRIGVSLEEVKEIPVFKQLDLMEPDS